MADRESTVQRMPLSKARELQTQIRERNTKQAFPDAESPFDVVSENWIGPEPTNITATKNYNSYIELVKKNKEGKRGLGEEILDFEMEQVPFIGGFAAAPGMLRIAGIGRKLSKGIEVTDDELVDFNMFIEHSKRKETSTKLAKAADIVQTSLGFGLEIAVALTGWGAIATKFGLAGRAGAKTAEVGLRKAIGESIELIAKKASTKSAKRIARKAGAGLAKNVTKAYGKTVNAISSKAGKEVAEEAIERAGTVAARKAAVSGANVAGSMIDNFATQQGVFQGLNKHVRNKSYDWLSKHMSHKAARILSRAAGTGADLEARAIVLQTLMPHRNIHAFANQKINEALKNEDTNDLILMGKALLDMNIEYASEFSGEVIGRQFAKLFRRSSKLMKGAVGSQVLEFIGKKYNALTKNAAGAVLREVGINNILEEMMEERTGGVLRGLLGVNDKPSIKAAVNGLLPGWDQFTTEMIAFSAMPLATHGANLATGGATMAEVAEFQKHLEGFKKQKATFVTQENWLEPSRAMARHIANERKPVIKAWSWLRNLMGGSRGVTGGARDVIGKGVDVEHRNRIEAMLERRGELVAGAISDLKPESTEEEIEAAAQKIATYMGLANNKRWSEMTEADVQLMNGHMDAGRIQEATVGRQRYLIANSELSSDEQVKSLMSRTGVYTMAQAEELLDGKFRMGQLDSVLLGKDWSELTEQERDQFGSAWGLGKAGATEAKYKYLRRLVIDGKAAEHGLDIANTIPLIVTGTFGELSGMGLDMRKTDPVWKKNEEGEDIYYRLINGFNTVGGRIDLGTLAMPSDMAEETLEVFYRRVNHDGRLTPHAEERLNAIYNELLADESAHELDPSNAPRDSFGGAISPSERRDLIELLHHDNIKGRKEAWVKMNVMQTLGGGRVAGDYSRYNERYGAIPVGPGAMDDLAGVVPPDLLRALPIASDIAYVPSAIAQEEHAAAVAATEAGASILAEIAIQQSVKGREAAEEIWSEIEKRARETGMSIADVLKAARKALQEEAQQEAETTETEETTEGEEAKEEAEGKSEVEKFLEGTETAQFSSVDYNDAVAMQKLFDRHSKFDFITQLERMSAADGESLDLATLKAIISQRFPEFDKLTPEQKIAGLGMSLGEFRAEAKRNPEWAEQKLAESRQHYNRTLNIRDQIFQKIDEARANAADYWNHKDNQYLRALGVRADDSPRFREVRRGIEVGLPVRKRTDKGIRKVGTQTERVVTGTAAGAPTQLTEKIEEKEFVGGPGDLDVEPSPVDILTKDLMPFWSAYTPYAMAYWYSQDTSFDPDVIDKVTRIAFMELEGINYRHTPKTGVIGIEEDLYKVRAKINKTSKTEDTVSLIGSVNEAGNIVTSTEGEIIARKSLPGPDIYHPVDAERFDPEDEEVIVFEDTEGWRKPFLINGMNKTATSDVYVNDFGGRPNLGRPLDPDAPIKDQVKLYAVGTRGTMEMLDPIEGLPDMVGLQIVQGAWSRQLVHLNESRAKEAEELRRGLFGTWRLAKDWKTGKPRLDNQKREIIQTVYSPFYAWTNTMPHMIKRMMQAGFQRDSSTINMNGMILVYEPNKSVVYDLAHERLVSALQTGFWPENPIDISLHRYLDEFGRPAIQSVDTSPVLERIINGMDEKQNFDQGNANVSFLLLTPDDFNIDGTPNAETAEKIRDYISRNNVNGLGISFLDDVGPQYEETMRPWYYRSLQGTMASALNATPSQGTIELTEAEKPYVPREATVTHLQVKAMDTKERIPKMDEVMKKASENGIYVTLGDVNGNHMGTEMVRVNALLGADPNVVGELTGNAWILPAYDVESERGNQFARNDLRNNIAMLSEYAKDNPDTKFYVHINSGVLKRIDVPLDKILAHFIFSNMAPNILLAPEYIERARDLVEIAKNPQDLVKPGARFASMEDRLDALNEDMEKAISQDADLTAEQDAEQESDLPESDSKLMPTYESRYADMSNVVELQEIDKASSSKKSTTVLEVEDPQAFVNIHPNSINISFVEANGVEQWGIPPEIEAPIPKNATAEEIKMAEMQRALQYEAWITGKAYQNLRPKQREFIGTHIGDLKGKRLVAKFGEGHGYILATLLNKRFKVKPQHVMAGGALEFLPPLQVETVVTDSKQLAADTRATYRPSAIENTLGTAHLGKQFAQTIDGKPNPKFVPKPDGVIIIGRRVYNPTNIPALAKAAKMSKDISSLERQAKLLGIPVMRNPTDPANLHRWMRANEIKTLNVLVMQPQDMPSTMRDNLVYKNGIAVVRQALTFPQDYDVVTTQQKAVGMGSMYVGPTWNVEKATRIATPERIGKLKESKAAMEGDLSAARAVARAVVKADMVEALNIGHKDIVASVETPDARANALPHAFADRIAKLANAKADRSIMQDSEAQYLLSETQPAEGMELMDKILFKENRAFDKVVAIESYSGVVERGRNYHLVMPEEATAEVATLRRFIESNGGKVVSVLMPMAKTNTKTIAPSQKLVDRVNEKFNKKLLKEVLHVYGIAENVEALPSETLELFTTVGNLEALEKRLAAAIERRSSEAAHARRVRELNTLDFTPSQLDGKQEDRVSVGEHVQSLRKSVGSYMQDFSRRDNAWNSAYASLSREDRRIVSTFARVDDLKNLFIINPQVAWHKLGSTKSGLAMRSALAERMGGVDEIAEEPSFSATLEDVFNNSVGLLWAAQANEANFMPRYDDEVGMGYIDVTDVYRDRFAQDNVLQESPEAIIDEIENDPRFNDPYREWAVQKLRNDLAIFRENAYLRDLGFSVNLTNEYLTFSDPWMYGESAGLRRGFIEADRQMRIEFEDIAAFSEMMRLETGAKGRKVPAAEREEVKKQARLMLRAAKHRMDDPKANMIIGSVEYAGKFTNGWDRYRPVALKDTPSIDEIFKKHDENAAKYGLMTSEQAMNKLKQKFAEIRTRANNVNSGITFSEWIGEVDHYIRRTYERKGSTPIEQIVRKTGTDTTSAAHRRFNTFKEAAEYGLVPTTEDAVTNIYRYGRSIWSRARDKFVLNAASIMMSTDTAPVFIPVFGDLEASTALDNETLSRLNENLARYAGAELGVDLQHNASADPKAELARMVLALGEDRLRKAGYKRVDTPQLSGVNGVFVLEGPAENVVRYIDASRWNNKAYNTVENLNHWMKWLSVSFSLFHAVALMESFIAFRGLQAGNPLFPWNWGKFAKDFKAANQKMKQNKEFRDFWMRHGAIFHTTSPDVDTQGKISATIEGWSEHWQSASESATNPVAKAAATHAAKGFRGVHTIKNFMDTLLWTDFHSTLKLMAMEEMKQRNELRLGRKLDTSELESIAQTVNAGLGGIEFEQLMWTNPKTLQAMHLGLFAPDWTIAAASIAGLGRFMGFDQHDLQTREMLTRYWPTFTTMILIGLPAATQASLYMAFGNPEGGDEPFPWMNEPDRLGHIDLTPLARVLPGYDGDPTGKRRVYIRFGKQAYEVFDGWFTKPADTLLNKTSHAVKMTVEQLTGQNVLGWDLGFKDKTFIGGMFKGRYGFWDSRVGTAAQHFIPMWASATAQGKASSIFVPVARGTSQTALIDKMQRSLDTWIEDPKVWDQVSKGVTLKDIVVELLDAAKDNGYNEGMIFQTALRGLQARYQSNLFYALNDEDTKGIERAAEKLKLLDVALKNILSSQEWRFKRVGRQIRGVDKARIEDAYQTVGG